MYFRKKCKITFLCHGATIYSEEGRFSDLENYPPLSELGVSEMENLIDSLKARGVKNDAIYSSPSVRTSQSALMVAKAFKTEYKTIEKSTPRACGTWNGLTLSQILNKYPTNFTKLLEHPDKTIMGEAESSPDFIARIKKTIDEIVEENIGNRVIIVTHPDVIQAAICAALGVPADKLHNIFIRTGSATQISYFESWASIVYTDCVPLG